MIYGYIRVSTDKQTTENQRFEIQNFSKNNQITIDKWIEETMGRDFHFLFEIDKVIKVTIARVKIVNV